MIPRPTAICGYCGVHHDAKDACQCTQAAGAREARRAELERTLKVVGMGVSSWRGLPRPVDRR